MKTKINSFVMFIISVVLTLPTWACPTQMEFPFDAELEFFHMYDGGMDAGGGALVKDSRNPWFIQNTETVNFCIDADYAAFSYSPLELDEMIYSAINYWKDQFRNASWHKNSEFFVATQEFIKTECNETTDLRFQFGKLSADQVVRLKGDPRDYLAFTVLSEYDRKHLRGKGFVYISPDKGEWKYRYASNTIKNPWHREDGKRLFYALVHELGHVFGMPHMESSYLMASRAVEGLVLQPTETNEGFPYSAYSIDWTVILDPMAQPGHKYSILEQLINSALGENRIACNEDLLNSLFGKEHTNGPYCLAFDYKYNLPKLALKISLVNLEIPSEKMKFVESELSQNWDMGSGYRARPPVWGQISLYVTPIQEALNVEMPYKLKSTYYLLENYGVRDLNFRGEVTSPFTNKKVPLGFEIIGGSIKVHSVVNGKLVNFEID